MTDEASNQSRIDKSVDVIVDFHQERQKIIDAVAERTGMSREGVERVVLAKEIADIRGNLYATMETIRDYASRENPIREKQRKLIERVWEELDDGEDWKE